MAAQSLFTTVVKPRSHMDGAGVFHLTKSSHLDKCLNGGLSDDAVTVEVDDVLAIDSICGGEFSERYSDLNSAIC
eukprot:7415922-Ditylum_brightwellii.AAC.2